ncbi:MAG: hypothetical protein JWP83_6173 [Mycobacterium sp.]|jgi:hypothetical protein|uniref:hypothetical protein n=1 Tax=Mycobacterium sp. TaxID=1785 RepID=UPI0026218A47|nr:hypothetical protein [Mycobacterium sp.]MCW2665021.1 hypothetical protein [Mycobacterium sp.]
MKDSRLRERVTSDTRLHLLHALRKTSALPYYRAMHTAVDPITVVEGDEKIMRQEPDPTLPPPAQ